MNLRKICGGKYGSDNDEYDAGHFPKQDTARLYTENTGSIIRRNPNRR